MVLEHGTVKVPVPQSIQRDHENDQNQGWEKPAIRPGILIGQTNGCSDYRPDKIHQHSIRK